MKTIIYSFLVLFIIGMVAPGFTKQTTSKTNILVESADKNISAAQLSRAAEIITARLNDFSPGNFNAAILPGKNQIQITSENTKDLKVVEYLVTRKGSMEFYETWNQKDFIILLKGDNHLFTIIKASNQDNPNAKIGCTTRVEVDKVTEYLSSLRLNNKYKFAWASDFDKPEICLYALKPYGEKGSVLDKTDIESVKFAEDKIEIKLKNSAIAVWAEVTRRNMNNDIALLLDGNVISAPKVRSVIESGEIEISGKFSQTEAGYIASLLNNGELPADFKIVRQQK
jgi:preprotein translocase subunit SecD